MRAMRPENAWGSSSEEQSHAWAPLPELSEQAAEAVAHARSTRTFISAYKRSQPPILHTSSALSSLHRRRHERMGSEEEEKFGSDSASAIKYTLGFIVTLFVAVQAFFAVYNGYIID